jgi:hypothetical protein
MLIRSRWDFASNTMAAGTVRVSADACSPTNECTVAVNVMLPGTSEKCASVIHHRQDSAGGYDGMLEPGMTICIESYIGEDGGAEGVKLEQQVLITEDGQEVLSTFPFESALLDASA